jgi:GNAT superfamily N-acetyltransferase
VAEPLDVSHATRGEHAAILTLHREAGWPGKQVDGEVWAARQAGALLGSVLLIELAPALILIDAAVVRADARGRGIGEQMLRVVLATRSATWWLECREERISFYERLGFSVEPITSVPPEVTARMDANPMRPQHFLSVQSGPGPVCTLSP